MKKWIRGPFYLLAGIAAGGSFGCGPAHTQIITSGDLQSGFITGNLPNVLPDPMPYDEVKEGQNEYIEFQIKQAKQQFILKHRIYIDSLQHAPGDVMGTFSTSLAGHDASGRVHNIRLACSKINGTLLMPGQVFSFNGLLGDSNDPSAGWQEATVIVGKKFEEGYGGGICQVSSTLYNAVLQAGLEIQERYTHSLPVGYVESGHDATVSYPELDFKFQNSLPVPVRIVAVVSGDSVVCNLEGLPAEN